MIRPAVAGLTLVLCLGLGCASRNAREAAPAAATAEPQGPVIVHLVGQHQTITVTSGPDGPLYTARTADGEPIVANASLKSLRERHPEVYRLVEPTMAVHADVDEIMPDGTRSADAPAPRTSGETGDRVIMLDAMR